MTKKLFIISQFRLLVAVVHVLAIASVALVPVLIAPDSSALQINSRKVTIGGTGAAPSPNATKPGQSDVTYSVEFSVPTSGNIGGLVIDFCSNGPVVGTACTPPNGFDVNKAGVIIANQTGLTGWTVDASNSSVSKLVLTRTASSYSGAVSFDLGSTGASDGITNPTQACNASSFSVCTFYARILTYAATGGGSVYTSGTVPGGYVDSGGVAVSTASQLTISAQVAEVLNFCVGTINAGVTHDCQDLTGTSIDLGVLDNTLHTDGNGKIIIRTNATSGATIVYYAEKDNGSGKLKVPGATCSGTVVTDQCINSSPSAITITANTEGFGLRAQADTNNGTVNGTTNNIQIDSNYSTGNYAWDDTNAATLASSTAASVKVLDNELINLTFAATTSPTTPAGAYTVTQTYIATSTF